MPPMPITTAARSVAGSNIHTLKRNANKNPATNPITASLIAPPQFLHTKLNEIRKKRRYQGKIAENSVYLEV